MEKINLKDKLKQEKLKFNSIIPETTDNTDGVPKTDAIDKIDPTKMVTTRVDMTNTLKDWICGCGKTHKWNDRRCYNCESIERLKGITCPGCKGANIGEGGVYENNGVMGPGYSSWNKFPHLYCKDCGIIFYKIVKDEKEK